MEQSNCIMKCNLEYDLNKGHYYHNVNKLGELGPSSDFYGIDTIGEKIFLKGYAVLEYDREVKMKVCPVVHNGKGGYDVWFEREVETSYLEREFKIMVSNDDPIAGFAIYNFEKFGDNKIFGVILIDCDYGLKE